MPLHDWTEGRGWDGVHLLWITELLRWIKPRLPSEYRVYVGTWPIFGVGVPPNRPDVSILAPSPSTPEPAGSTETAAEPAEPDIETMTASIHAGASLFVVRAGVLVAAVELISPLKKDRESARDWYATRFAGYLTDSVNLLLIDVHPRPLEFSFADRISGELGLELPPFPSPHAITYRVAASEGSLVALWSRPLAVGAALPTMPLPLTVDLAISVDLEQTYSGAAADAYLS